jgi:hypothetical protein
MTLEYSDLSLKYIGLKAEVDALYEYMGGRTCYPRTDWQRTLVDEVKAKEKAVTRNLLFQFLDKLGAIEEGNHMDVERVEEWVRTQLLEF